MNQNITFSAFGSLGGHISTLAQVLELKAKRVKEIMSHENVSYLLRRLLFLLLLLVVFVEQSSLVLVV
jgi:hypothetical protein